jgi:hypothetical protein
MNLRELLVAVKDKNLSKEQIEDYYGDLTHVYSSVCLELADLKKKEAFYFLDHKQDTDVATKRAWRVTSDGQRMIELEAYKNVIPRELASLKNRIYSLL